MVALVQIRIRGSQVRNGETATSDFPTSRPPDFPTRGAGKEKGSKKCEGFRSEELTEDQTKMLDKTKPLTSP